MNDMVRDFLADIERAAALLRLDEDFADEDEEVHDGKDYMDQAHAIVQSLHRSAEYLHEIFEACLEAFNSEDRFVRAIAADVLGQLGIQPYGNEGSENSSNCQIDRPYASASIQILQRRLTEELDCRALESALVALGHLDAEESAEDIAGFVNHYDPDVREGAAWALSSLESPAAVRGLLALARDTDDDVRNWAIFGLYSREAIPVEYVEAVRSAFFDALSDCDEDVQLEAIRGLAKMKDVSVLDALVKRLESNHLEVTQADLANLIESAGELCDVRLLPLLETMLGEWDSRKDDAEKAVRKIRDVSEINSTPPNNDLEPHT